MGLANAVSKISCPITRPKSEAGSCWWNSTVGGEIGTSRTLVPRADILSASRIPVTPMNRLGFLKGSRKAEESGISSLTRFTLSYVVVCEGIHGLLQGQ